MTAANCYTAWHRRDRWQPWSAIVEAPSESEALNRAIDRTRGGDLVILPSGQRPANGRAPHRKTICTR